MSQASWAECRLLLPVYENFEGRCCLPLPGIHRVAEDQGSGARPPGSEFCLLRQLCDLGAKLLNLSVPHSLHLRIRANYTHLQAWL